MARVVIVTRFEGLVGYTYKFEGYATLKEGKETNCLHLRRGVNFLVQGSIEGDCKPVHQA